VGGGPTFTIFVKGRRGLRRAASRPTLAQNASVGQPRLRQLGSRSRQENALGTAASVVAHLQRGGSLPFGLGSECDLDRATPSGRHTVAAVVGLRKIPRVFAFKRDLINRERSLAQVGELYRCR
jgi:hypothetical protein